MSHRRKPSGKRTSDRPRQRVVYDAERNLPLALRPWRPFLRATPVNPDGSPGRLQPGETFWASAHYLVHRTEFRYGPTDGPLHGQVKMVHLSMRTVENDVRHDWREMMMVKAELCGPDWEAVELYPAESRVVDTANQYHLFCFPPGTPMHEGVQSIGFNEGRHVYGPDDEIPESFLQGQNADGHVQRPLPDADTTEAPTRLARPPRRVPFDITHTWESQAVQYEREDVQRLALPGIVHWRVPAVDSGGTPIHCLLYFTPGKRLVGILNYYPEGSPVEDLPHDFLVVVAPEARRAGIGTKLVTEALARWPEIDLLKQCYTDAGWALAESVLRGADDE